MGRGEGHVLEEGFVPVTDGVFLEMVDGGIGHRDGPVEAGFPLDRGQFHVVLPVHLRAEEAALVLEVVGVVEAILQGHSIEVPFAGVVATVSALLEIDRDEWSPGGSGAAVLCAGQVVAANLLGVVTGQEGRAGGPAPGGVVELGVAQAAPGKGIEVGRADLPPVTPEVRVAQVVRHDEQDIGLRGGHGSGRDEAEKERQQKESGRQQGRSMQGE